jgi:NADPH-dependent 2,4-dienoyl-CoA reductase/sulfur reductase-like enzyme/Fe-S-cluster-containing hydrogenase component 2
MLKTEVAVVGAGPAGLSAACAAAEHGAQVTVIDDQTAPGGQLIKQVHKFFGSEAHLAGTRGFKIGQQLLSRASELGVNIQLGSKVVGMYDGSDLWIIRDGRMDQICTSKVILATGARERTINFAGWTLPGVIGAGGAQTMMNVHRVLPGRRVLMMGSGNVGLIVAFQLLQAGAEVVAVVDAAPQIGGYWVHAAKLRRAGVPILTSCTVREARGKEEVEEVVLVDVDENWREKPNTARTIAVDTVCLAVGLLPSIHLTSLLGCQHCWDPARGGLVPVHDEYFETTVPGVYVAGDLAGIEEATTAMEQGRIAGLSAARALGYLSDIGFEELLDQARLNLDALRPLHPMDDDVQQESAGRGGVLSANAARTGVLDRSDCEVIPGWPSEERMRQGPVAVVECPETIPCDICQSACHLGAVTLEGSMTALPILDEEICTGCGLCVAHCSGMAIFVIDLSYAPDEATITFPYEFLPVPEVGAKVQATDREGQAVCDARVVKVRTGKPFDHTAVVTIAVPAQYAQVVRGIARNQLAAAKC